MPIDMVSGFRSFESIAEQVSHYAPWVLTKAIKTTYGYYPAWTIVKIVSGDPFKEGVLLLKLKDEWVATFSDSVQVLCAGG